ncbi:hypothetical protein M085_4137, partial [Bacteroides fragilis str. 3986 N(B)19]
MFVKRSEFITNTTSLCIFFINFIDPMVPKYLGSRIQFIVVPEGDVKKCSSIC